MESLTRLQSWTHLTIPTLKNVMKKLNMSPLTGRKGDLISRIVGIIDRDGPQIMINYNISLSNNVNHLGSVDYFVLQLLNSTFSPYELHLQYEQASVDPIETLQKYKYGRGHTPNFFTNVDLDALKTEYLYRRLKYFQTSVTTNEKYFRINDNILPLQNNDIDPVLSLRSQWVSTFPFERLAADAIRYMNGQPPIENNVRLNVDKLEAFDEDGFLFWRITSHGTVFETLPYGLSYGDQYGYGLIEVDDIQINIFNSETGETTYPFQDIYELCQQFSRKVIRSMYEHHRDVHPQNGIFIVPSKEMYSILNLGHILRRLMSLNENEDISPHIVREYLQSLPEPIDITLGQEHFLMKWFPQHPKYINGLYTPFPGIPHSLSDLIPDDLKTKLKNVLRLDEPRVFNIEAIQSVDIQFIRQLLIESNSIRDNNILDIVNTSSFAILKELGLIDNIDFQQYLRQIKSRFLNYVSFSRTVRIAMSFPSLVYYMACREFTYNSDEIYLKISGATYDLIFENVSYVACQVQDLGGLGDTVDTSNPLEEDMVDMLLKTPDIEPNILCRLLHIPNEFHLMTLSSIRNILLRGYINPVCIDASVLERYHLFDTLTPFTRQLLKRLYYDQSDIMIRSLFAWNERDYYSPLRNVVVECDNNIPTLTRALGMSIPPFVEIANETQKYILNNFMFYREKVVNEHKTNKNVYELTDIEIFGEIGGYVGYNSCLDLYDIYNSFQNDNSIFFVPYERKCVNTFTQTGDDTNDPTIFIIGFGNKDKYTCYTLDDLLGNFQPRGEDDDIYEYIIFENESLIPTKLNETQIKWLILLLTIYSLPDIPEPIKSEAQKVLNALILIENKYRQLNEKEKTYRATFRRLDTTCRDLIIKWLHEAFYVGMYMRQWDGPGHPFPMTLQQTQQKMINHQITANDITEKVKQEYTRDQLDDRLSPLIGHTQDIENELLKQCSQPQFLMDLPLVDYINDKYLLLENSPIKSKWKGVCSGEMCIRQWSRLIVITMNYYLLLFINQNIPQFNPKLVEKII
jgi:hypothetical protein